MNRQQRRARARTRDRPPPAQDFLDEEHGPDGPSFWESVLDRVRRPRRRPSRREIVEELVVRHRFTGHGPATRPADLDAAVAALTAADPEVDSDGVLGRLLVGAVGTLYRHGWQPMDILHVVARQATQRSSRLAATVVMCESVASGAGTRAPREWRDQLAGLGELGPTEDGVVRRWFAAETVAADDAWRDGMRLLAQLLAQPPLQVLVPPPAEWGHTGRPTAAGRTAEVPAEPRTLARIRGLLAKAESTDFPDEAEALTAKAQDLMTRHAVDEAVLDARAGSDRTALGRRVRIENPYAGAKVNLLDAVGEANDVRVVWTGAVGMATAVGHPDDLDRVELLFTSLLIQATRTLAGSGRVAPRFRRAFYASYAARIGERLGQARADARAEAATAHGSALVPVLARRAAAVDAAFEALFPDVRTSRRRVVDTGGWHAGRAAADRADLGPARALR